MKAVDQNTKDKMKAGNPLKMEKELIDRLKNLTRLLQEGSEGLYEISEARAYNPRYYLAKAILDDLTGKYEELGGLLRAINAKKEEIF